MSKDHLVGDCSLANKVTTARWSLKAYAPGSIINMSTGKCAEVMEHEAANRGLRPEGLKIKGRAGRHNAGVPSVPQASEPGEEEEPFLRPSVKARDAPRSAKVAFKENKPKSMDMPSKKIMNDFVAALNRARRAQDKNVKNDLSLIYAGYVLYKNECYHCQYPNLLVGHIR
jgi:hypothetical protein